MNKIGITQCVLLAFVFAIAAGCSTAPANFYTLNSTATGNGSPVANCSVVVGPVSLPASVDRPQFTLQTAPNHVEIDEYHRWAAPLNENIARVVAGDLMVLLGTPKVATPRLANFRPAYRVSIDFQQFESIPGKEVLVEAVWVVHRTADGITRTGHTLAREPAQGDGFDAIAAAHSRAIARVSGDIAEAIREEAGEKTPVSTGSPSPAPDLKGSQAAGQ
jgi:uncharacterized lipoprotein YmbA